MTRIESSDYPAVAMAVLVPEQDLPNNTSRRVSRITAAAISDPYQALVGHPPASIDVPLRRQDRTTHLDIPYTDGDALYELVETLYIVEGWWMADMVVEGAQRALAWTLLGLFPVVPRTSAVRGGRADVHYSYPPADPLSAARTLVAALAKGWPMPVVLEAATIMQATPLLFSPELPQVRIEGLGVEADPQWLARALAQVVVALADARRKLTRRVRWTLWRVEREAMRQLTTTLTDAQATIVRETYRYFVVDDRDGAHGLLRSNVTTLSARTTTQSAGPPGPLAPGPAALHAALVELEPFAKRVRDLEETPRPGTTVAGVVDRAVEQARAALAREVGRRAQAFPVLARLDARGIRKGAAGNAVVLGDVVFPVLKQCYEKNGNIRSRVAAEFVGVADLAADEARPERGLAEAVAHAGAGKSIWSFWKYVERAYERIACRDDHLTRRTLDEVTAELRRSDAASVVALGQAMGELLVLGTAELAVRKLVPVLNVAMAAWHITTTVKEFSQHNDEFYCTLDPRDALVDAAPSVAGLALDIATEAVFAVV